MVNESVEALTAKIYQEGVEKAEKEGQEIIHKAKEKAKSIIAEAEEKAFHIKKNAESEAQKLETQTISELKLTAQKSLGLLKQDINNLIVWKIAHQPIEEAFDDKAFVQSLIEKMVTLFAEKYGEHQPLHIILPQEDIQSVKQFILKRTEKILSGSVEFSVGQDLQKGFIIEQKEKGFHISFTPKGFENYFKSLAKPKIYKMLFGDTV
jgi:V/A-type H+/Na+-transporting ATPase subunit E